MATRSGYCTWSNRRQKSLPPEPRLVLKPNQISDPQPPTKPASSIARCPSNTSNTRRNQSYGIASDFCALKQQSLRRSPRSDSMTSAAFLSGECIIPPYAGLLYPRW